MEIEQLRQQIKTVILDAVESLSGQELVCLVTRDEDGVLTPYVLLDGVELLADNLNGWMDNTPWNAPKSL